MRGTARRCILSHLCTRGVSTLTLRLRRPRILGTPRLHFNPALRPDTPSISSAMPDPVVPVTASVWGMEFSIHGERPATQHPNTISIFPRSVHNVIVSAPPLRFFHSSPPRPWYNHLPTPPLSPLPHPVAPSAANAGPAASSEALPPAQPLLFPPSQLCRTTIAVSSRTAVRPLPFLDFSPPSRSFASPPWRRGWWSPCLRVNRNALAMSNMQLSRGVERRSTLE